MFYRKYRKNQESKKTLLTAKLFALVLLTTMGVIPALAVLPAVSPVHAIPSGVIVSHAQPSDSTGALKTSFLTSDSVYANLTTKAQGSSSATGRVYVINGATCPSNLAALTDASGGYETYSYSTAAATNIKLVWGATTNAGTYILVIDTGSDGTFNSGADFCSVSFTISAPVSTYSVEFDQSGIPTSGVTWGVTVGVTDYTDTGSSITVSGLSGTNSYSYDTPVYDPTPGIRYVCTDGCTGSVTAATTESATFGTQYLLNVTAIPNAISISNVGQSPSGDDCMPLSPTNSVNCWYDSSTVVMLTAANFVVTGGNLYAFSGWSQDLTGSTNPDTITMDTFHNVTANYSGPVPVNSVLSQGLCPLTAGGEDTFRLIYTPDLANNPYYKLFASNPGQLGYYVIQAGSEGDPVDLAISLPPFFATQGANPIHVYSSFTISDGCYVPSDDVSSQFTIDPSGLTVTGALPSSGLIFVTVHLDFALKGTTGWAQGSSNSAVNTELSTTISDGQSYDISVSGTQTASATVYSTNVFKHDPGIAGIVLDSNGNPVQGVSVTVTGPNGFTCTTTTDQDGFYACVFKYTGKAALFTVTASYGDWTSTQSIYLKSNQLAQVNFTIT
jgi:Carboxypeptidase regulatory-like domain